MSFFTIVLLAFLLLIVGSVVRAVLKLRRFLHRATRAPHQKTEEIQESNVQPMVSCAYCGLHIPKHEALPSNDKFYCSKEHLNLKQ